MSEFHAVNTTTLTVPDRVPDLEDSIPTTPRPTIFAAPQPQQTSASLSLGDISEVEDAAKTPTRDSFIGMASQRPLPSSPLHARADSKMEVPSILKREGSHRSMQSLDLSQDTEMTDAKDSGEASDEDGDSSDDRPSKKKKGQRFFCLDFPPCDLSFTRSEHLARHIRKHTGERPFQCHCSRRFSRLDNLRQHAQTVHVNEDIPDGSLAATGTRFQRQIRTDRVRPSVSRARSSTMGSVGGHGRGHSRNLSTSSINSVSTTTSSMAGDELMRRSTPLMPAEPMHRSRLSLDTFGPAITSSPGQTHYHPVGTHSPSGYSTPTSTTFSQGTGSPRFSSGFHSPVSNANAIPRSVNFEPPTPGRRLSVPGNPFTPQTNTTYTSPFLSSVHSGASSMFASPTTSYGHSRRESTSSIIDMDQRRRTWHPNSHTGLIPRPGTSGLQQYQTPDNPRPVFPADKLVPSQAQSQSQIRLPGIDSFGSFDEVSRPIVVQRAPSPMQVDMPQHGHIESTIGAAGLPRYDTQRDNRLSWDSTLQRGLSSMELERASQDAERGNITFGQQTSAPDVPRPRSSHVTFLEPSRDVFTYNRHRLSDEPLTPLRNKRMAWYHGPVQPAPQARYASTVGFRTSPDGSNSSDGFPTTPLNSSTAESHPAILHSNGVVELQRPQQPSAEVIKAIHAAPAASHYGQISSSNLASHYTQQHVPHQVQNASYASNQAPPPPPPQYSQPSMRPPVYQPTGPSNDMQRLEALVAVATRENQAVGGT